MLRLVTKDICRDIHKLNMELKKIGVEGTSRGHEYVEEQIRFNVSLKELF